MIKLTKKIEQEISDNQRVVNSMPFDSISSVKAKARIEALEKIQKFLAINYINLNK